MVMEGAGRAVGRHGEGVEAPRDHLLQPSALLGDGPAHAPSQSLFDLLELRPHAVGSGLPFDLEVAVARFAADEGEAEEGLVALSLRNDNLQILARHDHSAVVGLVHARDEGMQVVLQTILPGFIESREGLEHRAIVGSEHIQKVFRRAIAEVEGARLGLDRDGGGTEHFDDTLARSPECTAI